MPKPLLSHPLTRDIPLDSPDIIPLRARIVKQKKFLYKIYLQWYRMILSRLPIGSAPVLELGTGPGFLKELLPELITSDVVPFKGVNLVLNGQDLPFTAASLRAIVMVDVLHHIQNPRGFFASAARAVLPGGCIVMVEPWNTFWSRWVYTHLHYEGFDPAAPHWELEANTPLSHANGALPWILFKRDLAQFSQECPEWKVEHAQPMMPLVYLASGGLTTAICPPTWSYPLFQAVERILSPFSRYLGMFALISLRRSA